ncbi:Mycolic acid cyclopropane synthetase-domain-containing protein, partial [Gorgonomyces haynaldii]
AQNLCLANLKKIQYGHLTVVTQGVKHEFGDKNADSRAELVVIDPVFWMRLIAFSALGLGEAYMYGDIQIDDLARFLDIIARNRDHLNDGKQLPVGLNLLINNVFTTRITNSLLNSRANISAHYDLGNDMFSAFLDPTMMYSCPIWKSEEDTLEQAQIHKIHAMLDRSGVREGDLMLEIGTGWGALAIEAVKRHKCKVITITLSSEQKLLAEERIRNEKLQDKITVLLQDYRTLDPAQYQFDRIISIEMLEAVGPEYLATYFEVCERLMKPHATLTVQVITMPESRYENYKRKTDFIQKHIFPGGHCPSFTALVEAAHKGTNGKLNVDEMVNIGPHYAKALRLWRENFVQTFDKLAALSGKQDIYDDVFKRKFEYYFAFCEVGFATRTLGDLQIRFTRANNTDLIRDVPF